MRLLSIILVAVLFSLPQADGCYRPARGAAPTYTPKVLILHGNLPHQRGQGIAVQVVLPHDVHPTAVRLIDVGTGQVVRLTFLTAVRLPNNTCHVTTVLQTEFPAAVVGQELRTEVLIGDTWYSAGTVRIRAR